jgi:hypothetical protein
MAQSRPARREVDQADAYSCRSFALLLWHQGGWSSSQRARRPNFGSTGLAAHSQGMCFSFGLAYRRSNDSVFDLSIISTGCKCSITLITILSCPGSRDMSFAQSFPDYYCIDRFSLAESIAVNFALDLDPART